MRRTVIVLILVLLTIMLAAVPALASGTFDGTYDYAYNLYGPDGWVIYRVPSGVEILDSHIYCDQGQFSGAVDADGNVYFTGLCPYGDPQATFTGTMSSDGEGKGHYTCPYKHTGSWSMSRVSGGGLFDFNDPGFIDTVYLFSGIVFVISIISIVLTYTVGPRSKKAVMAREAKKAETARKTACLNVKAAGMAGQPSVVPSRAQAAYDGGSYAVTQAETPAGRDEMVPPTITADGARPLDTSAGLRSEIPLPDRLDLQAVWGRDNVSLTWKQPAYDPGQYRLDGYTVSRLEYGPGSTAPVQKQVARLPADALQWGEPFKQTFQHSTAGDIKGYTVDAWLSQIMSTGNTNVIRVGEMAQVPLP